ncbi:MAG TPA: bifunctional metallophosphatase/5'-nucleotidase [candidate division WOR-3 bacterium]|uniref:Bifunctional metallophosphatase/5'-nucleotidase n=1 Tax=candidate division WOR-3 bacterium TaxID=2052148 RepID=A0A7V0T650_UNCW3|nr:bifunctional metallophosphatase/5'-nucleotidase [candidate division WOR-3 bacterium]
MRFLLALLIALTTAPASVRHLRIVHTNDIHGALLPSTAWWMNRDFPPPLGGAASALGLVRELRAEAEESGRGFLLLDAGDCCKGTPIGEHENGAAIADWFRRAGYDAVGVGNHDYADGIGRLRERVRAAGLPRLNANIRDKATEASPDFLTPRLVIETGGLRVGIVGLISSYQNELIADAAAGDHLVLNEREAARAEVTRLREDGADIVVGLTHIGHRYEQRLAEEVPGFDVIIGGRSHTALRSATVTPGNHTIVVQAASRLTAVGVLDLEFDAAVGTVIGYEWELVNLFDDEFPPDADYARYLDSLRLIVEAGFDDVIGWAAADIVRGDPLRESAAGNFVTDAMRGYANADVAFQNAEGITRDLREGEITYRDLHELDGHGNTIVVGTYTGRQVREMLEAGLSGPWSIWQVSGLRVEYDPAGGQGRRARSVTVAGEPLEPERRYRVATNSWLGGEDGRFRVFRDGEQIEDTEIPVRDALAAWVRVHSPVSARVEGRIVRAAGR